MFDNAEMVGIDLSYASLIGATFTGASLGTAPGAGGAANLSNAYMLNVDLSSADMRSVDLTGAHIYGANAAALFHETHLDSADLTGALLSEAIFSSTTLTAATLNGAQLVNANFDNATLTNAKFDNAYLQGADFSTAASVTGVSLANAAVSTTLTSTMCTLTAPGSWTYKEQDGTTYTYQFDATKLQTDGSVLCPDNRPGPCTTGDSLCPIEMGPFPVIPECVSSYDYCYENCLMPPCFQDKPPNCPFAPTCN
jgi:hypothetical protein